MPSSKQTQLCRCQGPHLMRKWLIFCAGSPLFEDYWSIITSSIPKRINVFAADVYWARVAIIRPLKRAAVAAPSQVRRLHTSAGPADVWSGSAAAAVPAAPWWPSRSHVLSPPHLWSAWGFIRPRRARASSTVTVWSSERRGPCLRSMEICAWATWILSTCITREHGRPATWSHQVGGALLRRA